MWARAEPQPCPDEAVHVCDSGDHRVPAHSKEPCHLLHLLPAACTCMVLCPQRVSNTPKTTSHTEWCSIYSQWIKGCFLSYTLLSHIKHFRSGTLTDLIRSAPSLPLWKCFGYFVLVALGVELLVSVFAHGSLCNSAFCVS